MKLISILNKISAWLLMAFFLLFILSGFDIQRRIFSPQFSAMLHLKYIVIPAQIAFAFHSSYAVYKAFIRKKCWNIIGKGITVLYILFNIMLIVFFIFMQIAD
ncbi:MAG: hypothetical protein ACYCX2_10015 [Christensenellales bacterium]